MISNVTIDRDSALSSLLPIDHVFHRGTATLTNERT